MAGKNQAVLLLATLILGAICGISLATTYTVGDSTGWTIPSSASVYPNWASGKNFKVGDTLVFNFPTGAHTVAEVSRANFDSCNFANTIGAVITSGPANITLKSAGTHYYICTVGTHCRSNQKISIVVAASSATAPALSPTASGGSTVPAASPATSPTSGATPPSGSTTTPAASPTTPGGGATSPSGSTSSPSGSPTIPAADGPSTTSAPAPSFASSTSVGVLSLVSVVVVALMF